MLQGRSITWISVKTPKNIQINILFEITLDRQLPKGLIPLDVLHNIQQQTTLRNVNTTAKHT